MTLLQSLAAATACMTLALPAAAHEFWIAPLIYEVPSDSQLIADIRVGERMVGSASAYIPPNFRRFEVRMNGETFEVPGRAGDRPALNMRSPEAEGLAVVVHETKDYTLTYKDWDTFAEFTEHKDVTWAQQDHIDRGLPKDKVRERYTRYGKSLIGVGAAEGSDAEVGLRTEIVAETNPYTDDLSDGFTVRVLYEGAPRTETQVELFEKAPGAKEATSSLHRTDAEGRVTLPVAAGHEYLVDSVVMNPLDPGAEDGPAWESLWASLTFRAPVQ